MMSSWQIAGSILFILVLLVMAALLSLAETALTTASPARIKHYESEGVRRASLVSKLIADREHLIGGILLGNNVVNILSSALATSVLIALTGEAGVALTTIIMTVLIVVFGEVLPKTYAIHAPERAGMAVAPLISVVVALLSPVVNAVKWIVRRTLRMFSIDIDESTEILSAHEEIRGQIDLHHEAGDVVKDDRDMLGGILDLEELEVSEVMVHRKAMETIDADSAPAEIIGAALRSAHTRIPLYRGEPDNIIGVLHAKDLLRALAAAQGRMEVVDIKSILQKPWFVPDTRPIKEQLAAFLSRRSHFALVVDEYGTLMGLITLEDILEEIVGDIKDEHDIKSQGIRPQEDGSVQVDGAVAIRELNRVMEWTLPDDQATTIAGLVIHEAQMIPEPGQAFSFHGFRFEILRKQRNQITALRLTRLEPREASAA